MRSAAAVWRLVCGGARAPRGARDRVGRWDRGQADAHRVPRRLAPGSRDHRREPRRDADQDGLEDGVEDLLVAPYQVGAACIAGSLFAGPGPYAVAGYPLGWSWSAANVGDARLPGFTCVDLAAFPAYEVSWTSPTGEWADITPFCEGTTEPACEWTAGGWLFRFEVTAGQLYPSGRQDLVPSGADGEGDGIDDTFDHLQVDPVDPSLVCVSRAAVGAHDPGPWSVVGDRWGWSFDTSRVALDDGSWLCHREVTDGSVGFALLSLDGGWVDLGQGASSSATRCARCAGTARTRSAPPGRAGGPARSSATSDHPVRSVVHEASGRQEVTMGGL